MRLLNHLYIVLVVLAGITFSGVPLWANTEGAPGEECTGPLAELTEGQPREKRVKHRTDEMAYLWFPWGSGWSKVHGELQVDDGVYIGLGGWRPSTIPKGVRGTNVYGRMHGGFVRFVLDASPEQRANANQMLDKDMNRWAVQTCASGAMHVINKSTKIHLPLPFRYSPFLSASYLYLRHRFGTGVKEIEVVGTIKPHQYALGVAGELAMVGTAGTVTYGLWFLGNYVLQLLPSLGLW